MFKKFTLFTALSLSTMLNAQTFTSDIPFLAGEKWWGTFVAKGSEMPYLQSAEAVGLLIPDMIAAGLLGYAYACPDMIGGGGFTSFLNIADDKFDQTLIVRSTQVHALMPMMQFSVAPWRILSAENLAICREMAYLHVKMGDYILKCAQQGSQTGEPIIRHLEYMFPEQGFADCKDQFMLGEKLGNVYAGGKKITATATIKRLPYFEKI